jgi:hypothetical protein
MELAHNRHVFLAPGVLYSVARSGQTRQQPMVKCCPCTLAPIVCWAMAAGASRKIRARKGRQDGRQSEVWTQGRQPGHLVRPDGITKPSVGWGAWKWSSKCGVAKHRNRFHASSAHHNARVPAAACLGCRSAFWPQPWPRPPQSTGSSLQTQCMARWAHMLLQCRTMPWRRQSARSVARARTRVRT